MYFITIYIYIYIYLFTPFELYTTPRLLPLFNRQRKVRLLFKAPLPTFNKAIRTRIVKYPLLQKANKAAFCLFIIGWLIILLCNLLKFAKFNYYCFRPQPLRYVQGNNFAKHVKKVHLKIGLMVVADGCKAVAQSYYRLFYRRCWFLVDLAYRPLSDFDFGRPGA
ncbi:hypothetical protein GGTG_09877 [Gaeumannomyces tritici R3-111a-1]|uniref:Uncharacterized protein n=1 Tax=Gaeumannomyces tritici (strain R3-111a-1) TaxID=644352 RepID=J3P8P2_GAET3|nr:hypothetical protein GGTG_09877 [Gaeumannomyces tritici R3-111a-1]EJT73026.1 hypothetical protein GGTG_09877 [Gaeumannomyces tritici R3-111a-1]